MAILEIVECRINRVAKEVARGVTNDGKTHLCDVFEDKRYVGFCDGKCFGCTFPHVVEVVSNGEVTSRFRRELKIN